jgi:TatD DNase family protein
MDVHFLLTETDSPYLTPVPYRGKRNEPSYIPYIVRKIAELRQMPEEALAAVIAENWQRFLKLS